MSRWVALAVLLVAVFPSRLPASPAVLFENVRIFDGVDAELASGHVLVEDGRIARISATPIDPPMNTHRIDGRGRIVVGSSWAKRTHRGIVADAIAAHRDRCAGTSTSRPSNTGAQLRRPPRSR